MIRDPQAGLPSRPYHKQTHIYASAADLDPPVPVPYPSDQTRPWSAQGQGAGGGYPSQDRGRLNTFPYAHSGAPHAPQQRYPAQVNSQVDRGRSYVNVPPHAGNAARGGGVGMPASAQNLPTAKFEKDYYILDV